MKTNRLILGDGLLGSYLHNKTGWNYISRKKDGIDFTNLKSYSDFLTEYDEIINCIAHTDTYSKNREVHWSVNYKGVADLTDYCAKNNKKLIHISTDYIYAFSDIEASEESVPVHCNTWYGATKFLADGYIQLKALNYLLIRTTHKNKPFVHKSAFVKQIGNFDYVDCIGDLIIKLIEHGAIGIYNVGTETKTMYELAVKTKPDVERSMEILNANMPTNTSMDISKMKDFLNK